MTNGETGNAIELETTWSTLTLINFNRSQAVNIEAATSSTYNASAELGADSSHSPLEPLRNETSCHQWHQQPAPLTRAC